MDELCQRIGQLDLAAGARLHVGQVIEDHRRQQVAAHDGQRGRGLLGLRLFHHAGDAAGALGPRRAGHDTVGTGFLARHFLHGQHAGVLPVMQVDHLLQHRSTTRCRLHQVIGQQDGEGLVAHHLAGTQHGVAQAQRLGLTDVDTVHATGQRFLDGFQQLVLALGLQLGFQLIGLVEVILDAALVAPGDEDHLGDAGSRCLFHRILDQRSVDDRQHLLGLRLGGGKEAGTQPGDREYSFANAVVGHDQLPILLKKSASARTEIPRLRALVSFEPAFSPATTKAVRPETEPAGLPPSARIIASA